MSAPLVSSLEIVLPLLKLIKKLGVDVLVGELQFGTLAFCTVVEFLERMERLRVELVFLIARVVIVMGSAAGVAWRVITRASTELVEEVVAVLREEVVPPLETRCLVLPW
jgi:hypothetical protein